MKKLQSTSRSLKLHKRPAALLYQPQTFLGIIIMVIVFLVGGFTMARQLKVPHVTSQRELITASPSILSGIVTYATASKSAAVAIATDATSLQLLSASTSAAQNTSPSPMPSPAQAELRIRTKKNQTFWEFAKRYCGSHTYAEKLAKNNGYKLVTDLKEGDWITVTCS